MATVTRVSSGGWDVTVSPNESVKLGTSQKYIDGDIQITALGEDMTTTFTITTTYGNLTCARTGNVINVYGFLSKMPSSNTLSLGNISSLKSVNGYNLFNLLSETSPYIPIGSLWIGNSGTATMYKGNQINAYVYGTAIVES